MARRSLPHGGERLLERRPARYDQREPVAVGDWGDREGARGGRRACRRFGAHSLRSNFATSAAHSGFGEAAIMKHGRWKSVAVARRYTRADNRWDESDSVLLRKADARDTCPFWSFPTNRATTR